MKLTGKVISFSPRSGAKPSDAGVKSVWAMKIQCVTTGPKMLDRREEVNADIASAVAQILFEYEQDLVDGSSSLRIDCIAEENSKSDSGRKGLLLDIRSAKED